MDHANSSLPHPTQATRSAGGSLGTGGTGGGTAASTSTGGGGDGGSGLASSFVSPQHAQLTKVLDLSLRDGVNSTVIWLHVLTEL
jgi:hypothetical protein